MTALLANLDLIEPVLIAEIHGGDPNSAVGLPYMPGSTLRGALMDRYQRQYQLDDLANDETARRLFFDGAVRYLNAYPLTENNQRMLPTPLSWHIQKDTERDCQEPVYDFAVHKPERDTVNQPKPVRVTFCSLQNKKVQLHQPERTINIHIYRAKRSEQSRDDTIFRYEALAAGQKLQAIILADDPADLAIIQALLSPPELSLGKSRRAGYGRVRVEVNQTDWNGEYQPGDLDDEKIIVTCLSDILIRDQSSSYACHLNDTLGVKHRDAFVRPHIIGGFNRTWGLPLPQQTAIRAGSVFVYDYCQELWEILQQQVETGIGERLAEGFGRIAVNWQQEPQLTKLEPQRQGLPLSEPLTGSNAEIALKISARVLRSRFDTQLAVTVNKLKFNNAKKPTNTQLSRLRRVVNQAIRENNPGLISNHLKNLKETARKQFTKTRLENVSLNDWIMGLAKEPQSVWQMMNVQQEKGPKIGQEQAKRDGELSQEYALRLINGILHKATKEAGNE